MYEYFCRMTAVKNLRLLRNQHLIAYEEHVASRCICCVTTSQVATCQAAAGRFGTPKLEAGVCALCKESPHQATWRSSIVRIDLEV